MPLQAPPVLIPILAIFALGNPDIVDYDSGMKKPPWSAVARQQVQQPPNERELKERFAEYLLFNPYEARKAAELVSNGDYGRIFVREKNWPNDSEVLEIQKKLIAERGASYFIPSRETIIHNLWYRANAKTPEGHYIMENRDVIATHRLIGELAGYIGKNAETNGFTQNNFNQTVEITFVSPENKQENSMINVTPNSESIDTELPLVKFVS